MNLDREQCLVCFELKLFSMTALGPMPQIFLTTMSHFSRLQAVFVPRHPDLKGHPLLLHLNPSCHYHSLSCWPARFSFHILSVISRTIISICSPCPISATSPPTPTRPLPLSTTTAQPNPSSSSSPPYLASCSSPSSSGPTSTSPHLPNHHHHARLLVFPPSLARRIRTTTLSTYPISPRPNPHNLAAPIDSL